MEKSKKILQGDEIDLIELMNFFWSKRMFIIKLTLVFIAFGLFIAFTSPEEYSSSSVLIPESGGDDVGLGGSLSGLASLAGVDFGSASGSQVFNPALYQSISQSTPYLLELMDQEYYFSDLNKKISIYNYYIDHYKIGILGGVMTIPRTLISWVLPTDEPDTVMMLPKGLIKLSNNQFNILKNLQSRVFVEMDWDLNVVKIEIEMQDPLVAAQMVQFTQNYITNYVTEYSISKSKQQLESVEEQYLELKKNFDISQARLASFKDKNLNVTTARAKSEEHNFQSEYNLAFSVFSQIAQQREAIKLKIQEDRPIFTVLEPSNIPNEKSKPQRLLILIIVTLLGVIFGVLITLVKLLKSS